MTNNIYGYIYIYIYSSYPVAMHFNEQSDTIEDLRCIIIKNHVPDMVNRKLFRQKTIIKLNTHITGLNKDRDFIRVMTFKLSALVYCALGLIIGKLNSFICTFVSTHLNVLAC